MNERIKELEDQCWEDIPVDIDYDYLSRVRRVFNREKFAELIVGECAELCRARKLTPSAFTADELLEHFGVKE